MSIFNKHYDLIIIGGGPSGAREAARTARNREVLLLTSSWDTAAWPAGGPLVFDNALKNVSSGDDQATLQNTLGVFTRARRKLVNIDCRGYQAYWKYRLENTKRLTVFQDTCEKIAPSAGGWSVETRWGLRFSAGSILVAVGTFLSGHVRAGRHVSAGGRPGELCAEHLERSLADMGLRFVEETAATSPICRVGDEVGEFASGWFGEKQSPKPRETALEGGRTLLWVPMNMAGAEHYPYIQENGSLKAGVREARILDIEGVQAITPGYEVCYKRLDVGQLNENHECTELAGLFFSDQRESRGFT